MTDFPRLLEGQEPVYLFRFFDFRIISQQCLEIQPELPNHLENNLCIRILAGTLRLFLPFDKGFSMRN